MRYVIGILLIGVGMLIVWKANWLAENLGRIEWAERHLSSDGGTQMFYKLVGVLVIFIAFLMMGGGLGTVLRKAFAPGQGDVPQDI